MIIKKTISAVKDQYSMYWFLVESESEYMPNGDIHCGVNSRIIKRLVDFDPNINNEGYNIII